MNFKPEIKVEMYCPDCHEFTAQSIPEDMLEYGGEGMTIPPLPDHPRFRLENKIPQFATNLGYPTWVAISEINGMRLEDCCCVAIVAFLGEGDTWPDVEKMQKWRDYKKEVCG